MTDHVSVLVVGGALGGLSSALFLARAGVPVLLAERHAATSNQPRFRGPTIRSMEVLRGVGLEDRVRAAGTSDREIGGIAWVGDNLADPEVRWNVEPWEEDLSGVSPTVACACDQDKFEPLLLDRARELGAGIRFGSELTGFEQDADGVTAVLLDRATGAERTVRADYLIAADGTHSPVRERLGIARQGPGLLGHRISIYFAADLRPELDGRVFSACFVEGMGASLLPRDSGLWQLSVPYRPEQGESERDFTPERCRGLIRSALGRDDVHAELRSTSPWEIAMLVAERFQEGRVFLVGDSAHVMPPTGGFGGNSAIQDAHNLAWKMAAVLAGTAGPGLLDTYGPERRAVAELTVAATASRLPASWVGEGADGQAHGLAPTGGPTPVGGLPPAADHNTVSLGYRYRSAAVLLDEDDGDPVEDPRKPTGRPGTRAAHVVLQRPDATRLSTLDLWQDTYVLLTGERGERWLTAAREAAAELGITLPAHRVGPPGTDADLSDTTGQWPRAYGVPADGATLIRPDGFVAWRALSPPDHPGAALTDALRRLHDRPREGVGVGADGSGAARRDRNGRRP
ncbi:FAD-dependent monooxygenase [Streptomyces formicae]|uniref:Monooxygenase n=2 Tax=Streptomyces TaxID=1883 RepID=A0A291QJQ1_9ACTN|nr:FAD-dependent monooxygenase [Streptomyces formicae]AQP25572.1 monooxygenase [Streptomyces sp. KY5]ATL31694.1 Monooxygenase [Streptomyces formicae]